MSDAAWATTFAKLKRRVKIIGIVHDISDLRYGSDDNSPLSRSTRALFDVFDVIIIHNRSMRDWLIGQGIGAQKLIELELFDYFSDDVVQSESQGGNRIIIAGNLNAQKAGYLKDLETVYGVEWHLYGSHYSQSGKNRSQVVYHGSFVAAESPGRLQGDWGLVWDGDSVSTCDGNMGRYLKYNNPHKLSLYLRAGIPVVVWKDSAVAEFVKRNGLGLTVGSLYEIHTAISSVSGKLYLQMRQNCKRVSDDLGNGRYTESALRAAIRLIGAKL